MASSIHPTGSWQPRGPAPTAPAAPQPRVKEVAGGESAPRRDQAELRRVLNDQILATLGKQVDPSGKVSFGELNPEDYTPSAVAGRILGFVEGAITASSDDGEAALAKLAEARKGIAQGFEQAKDILKSLDAFNGQVEEDAESTYALLQRGLDAMQRPLEAGGDTVGDFRAALASPGVGDGQIIAAQHASYQRSDRFELRIKTQDGDTITLQISRDFAAGRSSGYMKDEAGAALASRESVAAGRDFNYTVDGSLDDDERQAVEQLLTDVKRLSDDFFSGDAAGAFEQALKLGHDTNEIAHFSLNLRQMETLKTAAAYAEVAAYNEDPSVGAPQRLARTLAPLHDFLRGMVEVIEQNEPRGFFADTPQGIAKLFSDFSTTDDRNVAQVERLEKLTDEPFADTARRLVDAIRPQLGSGADSSAI